MTIYRGTEGLPEGWRGEWDTQTEQLRVFGPNGEAQALTKEEVEMAGSMMAALENKLAAVTPVFPPSAA